MSEPSAPRGVHRVSGIGGVFFRARDPKALQAWYEEHLGVVHEADGYVVFRWQNGSDERHPGSTVWAPFEADTDYFGPGSQSWMVNFRVPDLDAMLKQLRDAGVQVDDRVEASEQGRFGWCVDVEGNRVELWEPPEGQ